MIHIINRFNQHLYADILDQMFQLRHKIFVEKKGWKALEQESEFDIDQFDTDDAVYFLKLDKNDQILGGMRLVPTMRPTQLGTIFKEWCHFEPAPKAADVWEWSRYFIADNKHRSKAGYPVFYELFFAILEYAVAKKIVALTGFLEAITLPRLNALPWNVEYLGNIVTYGGIHGEVAGKGAAVKVNVDKRMLKITKRMKKMTAPYFALPLGYESPAPHRAYQPEVCFDFLDFMEQHSEHIDVLIGMANVFCDQREGSHEAVREAASEWLQDELFAESMRDFTGRLSAAHLQQTGSLTKQ